MAQPNKKKQAEMAERREVILDYMQGRVVTVKELAKYMELDSLTVNHSVRLLIYGGAVEHAGTEYIKNIHNHTTRVCRYRLTGKPFDMNCARETQRALHLPKDPGPAEPGVRRVLLMDKKPYKNQGGQGNVGWGPHIGTGSWGVV